MYWVIVFAHVRSVYGVQLYVHTGVRKTSVFVLCGEALFGRGEKYRRIAIFDLDYIRE